MLLCSSRLFFIGLEGHRNGRWTKELEDLTGDVTVRGRIAVVRFHQIGVVEICLLLTVSAGQDGGAGVIGRATVARFLRLFAPLAELRGPAGSLWVRLFSAT